MPYQYSLEEGETVLANVSFSPSRKFAPLCLVVTTHAVFLPRKKLFAVKDPTYFERVPFSQVLQVRIRRIRPVATWLLALPMIAAGATLTAIMFWPLLHGLKGEISGYPPALVICGLVVPFVARKRYSLEIQLVRGTFRWTPPILIDQASRISTLNFFGTLADAFGNAGVHVVDERVGDVSPPQDSDIESSHYPLAGVPGPAAKGVLRACSHCGKPIQVSRWDDLNGFLLKCPYCGGVHGKHWRVHLLALASFFLNAASFFFAMRWKRALPLAIVFAAGFLAADQLDKRSLVPESAILAIYAALLLGPLLINWVVALRHEIALGTALAHTQKPISPPPHR